MKITGRVLWVALFVLMTAGAAAAQDAAAPDSATTSPGGDEPSGRSAHSARYGVRAGYTDWDGLSQIHVGAHAYLGELWPNIEFTPNVELGFGGDAFVMTLNGDVTYLFTELVGFPWGLYGGGSLSFNLVDPQSGGTETDLGFSVLAGTTYTLANDHKAMAEIKFGIIDSPTFKITFGYTLF